MSWFKKIWEPERWTAEQLKYVLQQYCARYDAKVYTETIRLTMRRGVKGVTLDIGRLAGNQLSEERTNEIRAEVDAAIKMLREE